MNFSTWIILNDASKYDIQKLEQDFKGLECKSTSMRNELRFGAECVDFKNIDEYSKWIYQLSRGEKYSNWKCSIQVRLYEEEDIMSQLLNKLCLKTNLQEISLSMNLRSLIRVCKTLTDVGLSDILNEININASVSRLVKIIDGYIADEDAVEYITIINHNIDKTRKTIRLIEQLASSKKNNLQLGLANFHYASDDYYSKNHK